MSPDLALILSFLFVVWLFAMDRKRQGSVSSASWLPLIWMLIVSTKSPDAWLAELTGQAGDASEGLLSMLVYLGLFAAGISVLMRRKLNWQSIISNNKWLFLFFAYAGVSVIWADQTLVSGKLWIKDTGNIVMVLIVLSEQHPAEAVKSLLLSFGYILVTLSFLLVKYYPDIGRGYDVWTYQPIFIGAGTDKNSLGAALLISALGLVSSLLDRQRRMMENKWNTLVCLLLMAMTLWLLLKSNCATALACVIVGAGILLGMRLWVVRNFVQRLGLFTFIAVPSLALCLQLAFNSGDLFVQMLGRDTTLTGRTGIWEASLSADVNPLIGAGYCSFWYGERAKAISEKLGFYYSLQESHNGYLETYLTLGLVGLSFLFAVLVAGASKIMKGIVDGDFQQALRLTIVVVALIYNVTEAAFAGFNPIWFILLLVLMEYPFKESAPSTTVVFSADTEGAPNSESCFG